MTKQNKMSRKLYSKVWRAWHDIKRRCYDMNYKWYDSYGKRGIKLQDSWLNDTESFYKYVSNLPNFEKQFSIDRIDNNLGYIEGNIRWATPAEQVRNRSKPKSNTSGQCGVTWYYNKTGGTRAIAWWFEGDKTKSKSFPVKRFGLLPAYQMAVKHRAKMIEHLNSLGAGYTKDHGK